MTVYTPNRFVQFFMTSGSFCGGRQRYRNGTVPIIAFTHGRVMALADLGSGVVVMAACYLDLYSWG